MGIPAHELFIGPERLTLSACFKLSELELEMPACLLPSRELQVISSVDHKKDKKIILFRRPEHKDPVSEYFWKGLDRTLMGLIEKSSYDLKLEVEFRGSWGGFEKESLLRTRLPKFVDISRNKVVYRSGELG